jgi:hypothetical protein
MPLTVSEKVVQTVFAHCRQAEYFSFAEQELLDWNTKLSLLDKQEIQILPTLEWQKLPIFRRHTLEIRGFSMFRYMAMHLTPLKLPIG